MTSFTVNHCSGLYYFQYQKLIQTCDSLSLRLTNKFVDEKFSSCRWLHCKDLVGHFGCVNAIGFCKKGGEYLVSGGDDTRVLVWKLAEAIHGKATARCLKRTHLSNIFCASFDSENKHIITAGNDDQILRHNFETGDVETCLTANDATYDVCIHPENDNIFITAGEQGTIDLYDVRAPSEQVKLAQGPLTFHSANFNPVDPGVFATASSVKGVELWDSRFPLRCLKRFDSNVGVQCAMDVTFDNTGRYLVAVRQRLPPVLYHIDRNTSLVEFYQEGYYNSCTMKSVCFAGKKDNYIMSGSDDFNVYIWEIPKVDQNHTGIAKVQNSFLVLNGHRSIVNQVCFNKDTSMLCTAGVEKIIKMWSPFPLVGGKRTAREVMERPRTLYSRMDYARMIIESGRPLAHDYDDQSTSEDPRMMAFFDTLVQKEQDGSTDSDLSSTDDGEGFEDEQGSSNVEVLRRIRAMVFEQIRNLRDDPSEEHSSDNGRTEATERSSEDGELEVSEMANLSGTSGNILGESQEQGIGLERLREIITSQQGSTTNTQKRIAELRRDCLKNQENAAITSRVFSKCENKENNFEERTNELDSPQCSCNSWQAKPDSMKQENECFSDTSSSENDIETNYEQISTSRGNCRSISADSRKRLFRPRESRESGDVRQAEHNNTSKSQTSIPSENSRIDSRISDTSNANSNVESENSDTNYGSRFK